MKMQFKIYKIRQKVDQIPLMDKIPYEIEILC